jgi:hypothetical protein
VVTEVKAVRFKKSKGKLNHFQEGDFKRHGLKHYLEIPVENINFVEVKEVLKEIMLKEGFVFFEDSLDYSYRVGRDKKLKEFMLQFHHIK